MSEDKNVIVGKYNKLFNKMLNINITETTIVQSKGLITHLLKSNHHKSIKYVNCIPDIIKNPDYIGVNPNENKDSIELVKRYENNILIGLKVDSSNNTLYVSTMYDLQEQKLQRRLHSGRLIPFRK